MISSFGCNSVHTQENTLRDFNKDTVATAISVAVKFSFFSRQGFLPPFVLLKQEQSPFCNCPRRLRVHLPLALPLLNAPYWKTSPRSPQLYYLSSKRSGEGALLQPLTDFPIDESLLHEFGRIVLSKS